VSVTSAGCHCLRLVDLHVPGAVQSGEPVQLRCEYDLEGAELYSVKWYKNNVEFYRYLPSDVPPGQSYELLGTFVDHSRSDKNNVFLEKTDLNTEGMYGCEVSTEGPGFKTVKGERELRIYGEPSHWTVGAGAAYDISQRGDTARAWTAFHRPVRKDGSLQKAFIGKLYIQVYLNESSAHTNVNRSHRKVLSRTLLAITRQPWPFLGCLDVCLECTARVYEGTLARSCYSIGARDKPAPTKRRSYSAPMPRVLRMQLRVCVRAYTCVCCTCAFARAWIGCTRKFAGSVSRSQVPKEDVVRFPNVLYQDGNEVVVLGLRFRVEARHLGDSDGLRLKCTATQSRIVKLSSEEVVQGAHQRSSGFHVAADDASSQHNRGVSRLLHWWWIFEAALVLIALL
ncbi:unnamed protein product, partial [Ixodes hexagonus]